MLIEQKSTRPKVSPGAKDPLAPTSDRANSASGRPPGRMLPQLIKVSKSRGAGYLAATLGIAAVTAICVPLRSHINEMTVALAVLLVVLFVASVWERWPAILASVAGLLCLNYFFLPPFNAFTTKDPKNWIALSAFFVTALTAGRLSSWAKQQAAEAAASRSQARLASVYNRSLLEATLDPVLTIGRDGRINDVNAAAETITGHSRAELIGTGFSEYFTEPEKARAVYEQVLRGAAVRGLALELRHRGGHSISVLCDASLYRDAEGNVIGVAAAARPVGAYAGKPWQVRPDSRVIRHLGLFVGFASIFSAAAGLLSILRLTFHFAVLKSIILDQPAITINAALCLMLLGLALWLVRRQDPPSRIGWMSSQVMAGIVTLVGLLSLTERLSGWDLWIDHSLLHEAQGFVGNRPNLIAPITAWDFLLLGLAFLLLDRSILWRSRRYWPAQYLASFTAILSIAGLLDFILWAHVSYTHVALQTAVTLLLVSLALLCTRTERGLAELLAGSGAGGVLTRRLLPAAVIIPIVIGALSWQALSAGRYSVWSEVSLMTIAMITLLAAFAIWNGFVVDRGDVRRRTAEEALHRSEMELREAQRLAQVGSWWWDPKTGRVTWSAGLSHLVGRDPLLPPPSYKEHLAFFTPQSSAQLDAAVQRAVQKGTPFELDLEIVRTGGGLRSVTAHGEAEREAQGRVALVRGTVQDITERKQAEEALEKSAEEIRDLYNHAPCGYHSLDADGVFVRMNDTELEWLGYAREEVIGQRHFTDFLTPEGLKTFEKNFPRLKEKGVALDVEFDLVRKDGGTFPVLVSATAITDAAGHYLTSRSTVYDITERKREEQARAQLAAIVEYSHDAIISKTLDGQILTWNKAAERIFGYSAREIVGRPITILVPPEGIQEWQGIMAKLSRGESTERLETVRVRKDGQQIYVSLTISAIKDDDGNIVGAATIARDITARKKAEEALQASEANLSRAQEIAHLGSWHLDLARNRLAWSKEVFRIFGVPEGTALSYEAFLEMVHPQDRKLVSQAWAAALQGASYDVEHRILVRGEVKWVRERAQVEFDKAGTAQIGIGTVQDVTERKRAEKEIRLLALRQAAVAELGQQALRSDPLGQVLDEAVARVAQTLDVEFCKILELLADRKALLLRSGVGWNQGLVGQATVASGTDSQAGFTLLSKDPVVVEDLRTETRFSGPPLLLEHGVVSGVSVTIPTGSGPYGVLGAHTRQRRTFTEDEINFLQAVANVLGSMVERRRAEEALLRSNRAHRALSSCNEALVRATDESGLLDQICGLIVEEAGFRFCWVGHAEQDQSKSVRPLAQAGFEEGYLTTANITWAGTERGQGPTGTSIRTQQMQLVNNFATDPRLALWRSDALKRGYASALAIPLFVDSKLFGALTIYSAEPDAFGPEEVDLLTELADDLGYGITTLRTRADRQRAEEEVRTLNSELEQRVTRRTAQLQAANREIEQAREREIEIGFKIQQTLLLDQPPQDVPGLRVAALTIPSQRIDGDFYIFIRHSDECLDMIVGDVMGKGIPAALLGAATKSHFLRALSDLMSFPKEGKLPEPNDIVMLAHAELARHLIELDSFVTVAYARLNMSERRLVLVDCGHTGVVHWHGKAGRCEVLHGDNLPLGVREGELYDQISVPVEAGDLLLFYSDGITEARNAAGELFGVDRLEQYVQTHAELDPAALVEGIRTAVSEYSGAAKLADDLTSVAVRVEEGQVPVARAEIEVSSDLSHLRRAREFVRDFTRHLPGAPLDEESACALELAVNEAASNIAKHAYHGRTDQWIHMEADAFPSRLSIRLHYFGDAFDPTAAPPPPLDGSRESGFGTYIIARSVDEVRYYRDDRGRNCIALVKLRKPHAHRAVPAPCGSSEDNLKGSEA
jgi:PAS domain S-box-containing protein